MIELENNIKALRNAAGWTQVELGFRAGVSRKTINTIENKVFVPSTILALRIAAVFDRRVEDILRLVDLSCIEDVC